MDLGKHMFGHAQMLIWYCQLSSSFTFLGTHIKFNISNKYVCQCINSSRLHPFRLMDYIYGYIMIYIYTDGLKVRMTFWERAEGKKNDAWIHETPHSNFETSTGLWFTVRMPPSVPDARMRKTVKTTIFPCFSETHCTLRMCHTPPKLPNVKSDSLVRNGRTMFIHLSVTAHSRTASHSEMAGHRRPC